MTIYATCRDGRKRTISVLLCTNSSGTPSLLGAIFSDNAFKQPLLLRDAIPDRHENVSPCDNERLCVIRSVQLWDCIRQLHALVYVRLVDCRAAQFLDYLRVGNQGRPDSRRLASPR